MIERSPVRRFLGDAQKRLVFVIEVVVRLALHGFGCSFHLELVRLSLEAFVHFRLHRRLRRTCRCQRRLELVSRSVGTEPVGLGFERFLRVNRCAGPVRCSYAPRVLLDDMRKFMTEQ